VLLRGVDGNSSERREAFCRNISEKYHVSFALMENILDRCPIVLKKNLTFRKAEGLARTLKQYGGQISVEERRDTPPILLEFQQGVPRLLALESSQFRKTPGGMWMVENGLQPGETIVFEGLNLVRPGQKVQPEKTEIPKELMNF